MTDWSDEVRVRLETESYRYYSSTRMGRQLCDDIRAAMGEIDRLTASVARAEAEVERLRECGDALQREARAILMPGMGHLVDAIEAWTSLRGGR